MSDTNFRPQGKPRALYQLNQDTMAGLKATVQNNQPLMALEYVAKLLEDFEGRLSALEEKTPTKSRKPVETTSPA